VELRFLHRLQGAYRPARGRRGARGGASARRRDEGARLLSARRALIMQGGPASYDAANLGESCVLIVGLGLIGGSLAAALKRHGFRGRIVACDPSRDEIARGIEMGLIDGGDSELAPLVPESS